VKDLSKGAPAFSFIPPSSPSRPRRVTQERGLAGVVRRRRDGPIEAGRCDRRKGNTLASREPTSAVEIVRGRMCHKPGHPQRLTDPLASAKETKAVALTPVWDAHRPCALRGLGGPEARPTSSP